MHINKIPNDQLCILGALNGATVSKNLFEFKILGHGILKVNTLSRLQCTEGLGRVVYLNNYSMDLNKIYNLEYAAEN